ncbi:hypothetical protein [Plantactinospora sp. GCM10030261]|uniref:hypothetical protein n=1 Tax=Plantactinospora sp. GCM10030261 TaxID=3273420 RepID=UPI00360A7CFD
MDSLASLGGRLDVAATRLGTATGALAAAARLAPDAFGVHGPGRLGEIGRALHTRWVAAIDDRAREAGQLAAELTDVAGAVRLAARGYANSDQAARHRFAEEW